MTESQYGITKATPFFPVRDLLRVPHRGGILVVSWPAFGSDTYSNNLKEMSGNYSHSTDLPKISFREPTTSESISVAAYKFSKLVKPEIFDSRWFQAGCIVRTSEGVFVNPPKNPKGKPIKDEQVLKQYLKDAKKVNGIYLLDNDFGFAPYEKFKTGVQDAGDFAEGGLARVLEHTPAKKAENLGEILSKKNYKLGVNVWGFKPVSEPVLRVAGFSSDSGAVGDRLNVDGDWLDYIGCVFGVLDNAGEARARNFE